MKLALKQAKKGLGQTSPNPPVGAIIVSSRGSVLGSGYHHQAGLAHAEIDAIDKTLANHSARQLKNSTLYITLEPCSTCGKTPACTDSIIKHQFARVVYGCSDPNPAHRGRAKQLLSRGGIVVTSCILHQECQALIRYFTKAVTTGLPWLIAKSAMTLDGCTTLPAGQGPWITGKEALNDVQKLRSQVDAILIGGATLRQDDPLLTLRGNYSKKTQRQPWRVITSLSGELPEKSRVFTDIHRDRTQVYLNKSLRQVLKSLAKQGIHSVLLESGGKLLANALKNDLVDELVFYYAPLVGGGDKHAVQLNNLSKALYDIKGKKFGADLRIRGLIKRC